MRLVEEVPRGEGKRPDLLTKRDDREYRVASAFATSADEDPRVITLKGLSAALR